MKNNVATRLHRTLLPWKHLQDNEAALKCWANIFNVDNPLEIGAQLLVHRKIGVLIGELDHLRSQLLLLQLTPEIYNPPLNKIGKALSPLLVANQSAHVKQHLTPDVYTALSFCGDFLPHEEESISEEDFASLVGVIHDLETALQEPTIPSSLASLIRSHIALAETAIAEYPLRGANALKDAVKFAIGDIALSSSISPQGDLDAEISLRTLWEKMNKVADTAIKIEGLLQVGARISKLLEKLADK